MSTVELLKSVFDKARPQMNMPEFEAMLIAIEAVQRAVVTEEAAQAPEKESEPIYRYTCPSGHRWIFLATYTECPFCGVPGTRGGVWDGTWPAKEG